MDIYRILSPRGIKSSYFCFLDDNICRHFEQMGAMLNSSFSIICNSSHLMI